MHFLTYLTSTTIRLSISLILLSTLNGVVLSYGESSDNTKCVIHSSSTPNFLIQLLGSNISSNSCPAQHSRLRKAQLACSVQEFYSNLWQVKESNNMCDSTEKRKISISPQTLKRKREIATQKRALELQRRILQYERRVFNKKRRLFEQTSKIYEFQRIEYETARRSYENTRKLYESKRRQYERSKRSLEGNRNKSEKDAKEILREITKEVDELTNDLHGILENLRDLSSEMGSLLQYSYEDSSFDKLTTKSDVQYQNEKDEIAQEKHESKLMLESEQQQQLLEIKKQNQDKSAALLRQQIATLIHQQHRANVRNETDEEDDDAELEVVNFAIL